MSSVGSTAIKDGPRESAPARVIHPIVPAVLVVAMIGVVAITAPESLVLLGVGMLPTIGAMFADPKTARHIWVSVGALNFTGLFYWMLDLWSAHHPLAYAISKLASVTPILAGYGAAALGWAIYGAMPTVVKAVTAASLKQRRKSLVTEQRKLVRQWDSGIAKKREQAQSASQGQP